MVTEESCSSQHEIVNRVMGKRMILRSRWVPKEEKGQLPLTSPALWLRCRVKCCRWTKALVGLLLCNGSRGSINVVVRELWSTKKAWRRRKNLQQTFWFGLFWFLLCPRLTSVQDLGFVRWCEALEESSSHYCGLHFPSAEDTQHFSISLEGWILECLMSFMSIKPFEILIWQASLVGSFTMTVKRLFK